MRNALTVLLAIGLLVVSVRLYTQRETLRDQEKHIRELTSRLEAVPRTPTLEEQNKCAAQAREEFISEGYKPGEMAGFESHYNPRLSKCFVEIQSTDTKVAKPEIMHTKILVDAFEGKEYGSYIWETQRGKKYWEVPPLECKVTLLSGEETRCQTSDEFDRLVKQYMQ